MLVLDVHLCKIRILKVRLINVCLCVNPKEDKGRMKTYDTARGEKVQLVEPFFTAQDRYGKNAVV